MREFVRSGEQSDFTPRRWVARSTLFRVPNGRGMKAQSKLGSGMILAAISQSWATCTSVLTPLSRGGYDNTMVFSTSSGHASLIRSGSGSLRQWSHAQSRLKLRRNFAWPK